MKSFLFNVEGMKCGGCKSKIVNKLESQVETIEVNLDDKTVKVSSENLSGMTIKKEIEELGFVITKMSKAN